jgi:glycosylphosphatidylinositol transamidase (GPIT) subunit GPI8
MSSDAISTMVPSSATVLSRDDKRAYLALPQNMKIAVIHKVTLQDLLNSSNEALIHILWERNNLLSEW